MNRKESILGLLKILADNFGYQELSKATGVESSNLYKALNINSNPTIETVIRIANGLNVKIHLCEDPEGL